MGDYIMKIAYKKDDGKIVWRYHGDKPDAGSGYNKGETSVVSLDMSSDEFHQIKPDEEPGDNEEVVRLYNEETGNITAKNE